MTARLRIRCPLCHHFAAGLLTGTEIEVECLRCDQKRTLDATRPVYRGVSWHRNDERWRAKIVAEGKDWHLGNHESPEDAAKAYDTAARILKGSRAKTNFDDDAASVKLSLEVQDRLASQGWRGPAA